MSDALAPLQPIMARCGVSLPAVEFHHAVNVTFHQFESAVYDHEHQDMWDAVPRQIHLLIDDYLATHGTPSRKLALLDIGSGTGLASDSVLKSALGPHIASVDLLDTSSHMLEQVRKRARTWNVPFETHNGITSSLVALNKRYDWIITCSVLHHVPDLVTFTNDVARMQSPGGVFLHIQDPNTDFLDDAELKQRSAQAPPPPDDRFSLDHLWRWTKRRLTGHIDPRDYIALTNSALVNNKVVERPLTVQEIYSITDINVVNGTGASIRRLRDWLSPYELVSQRSYGFYGQLPLHLSPAQRADEQRWITERQMNGFHLGALWRHR